LVRRHEDTPMFDRAFAVFWDQSIAINRSEDEPETISMTLLVDDENEQDKNNETAEPIDDENTITLRFSSIETLREKDFAEYNDAELREAEQFMTRLRLAGPPKKSLRLKNSNARCVLRCNMTASRLKDIGESRALDYEDSSYF
jgi:uncharacterized protein